MFNYTPIQQLFDSKHGAKFIIKVNIYDRRLVVIHMYAQVNYSMFLNSLHLATAHALSCARIMPPATVDLEIRLNLKFFWKGLL